MQVLTTLLAAAAASGAGQAPELVLPATCPPNRGLSVQPPSTNRGISSSKRARKPNHAAAVGSSSSSARRQNPGKAPKGQHLLHKQPQQPQQQQLVVQSVREAMREPGLLHSDFSAQLFARVLQKLAYRRHYPDAPGFSEAVVYAVEHHLPSLSLGDAGLMLWSSAVLRGLGLPRQLLGRVAGRYCDLMDEACELPTANAACSVLWATACLELEGPSVERLNSRLAQHLSRIADRSGPSSAAADAAADAADRLVPMDLRMLWQADEYSRTVLGRGPLPMGPALRAAADAAWAVRSAAAGECSALQRDVYRQASALGLPTWLEPRTPDAKAAVDVALLLPQGSAARVAAAMVARAEGRGGWDAAGGVGSGGVPQASGETGAATLMLAGAEPERGPTLQQLQQMDFAAALEAVAGAAEGSGAGSGGGELAGIRVAIEVDGPTHFTRNAPFGGPPLAVGGTLARNRLLAAWGWRVLRVPHWEWRDLQREAYPQRQRYLALRLADLLLADGCAGG